MATATAPADANRNDGDGPLVDPRGARFGQTLTASGLLAGIALDRPVLVFAVTAVLLAAVLSRWRYDPYAMVWRRLAGTVVDPSEPEPAAPHRFAKLLGATGTTAASALIVAGVPLAGYALAAAVALAAGLAAATGLCLGCRMYRGVSLFRRLDLV